MKNFSKICLIVGSIFLIIIVGHLSIHADEEFFIDTDGSMIQTSVGPDGETYTISVTQPDTNGKVLENVDIPNNKAVRLAKAATASVTATGTGSASGSGTPTP